MSVEHGYEIKWTGFDGSVTRFSGGPYRTREARDAALANHLEAAKVFGWTPPRWWQWWRAGDTRISQSFLRRAVSMQKAPDPA